MKTIKGFRSYYGLQTLCPELEILERERKTSLRKVGVAAGAAVSVVLAVLGVLIGSGTMNIAILLIAIVAIVLATAGAWYFFTIDFTRDFKNRIIRKIIQYVDPGLSYTAEGKVSREDFEASTIFKHSIDRYQGEDFVEGQVDKTKIQFSELHAEYKTTTTGSKGRQHTQWHTIFKGLFFIADFNKNFNGRTIVLPDSAEKLFGRLGQKLQEMNLGRDDLVKLEDPEFEKEFVVYGTDQVEARYILSTALMRRILEFKRKMRAPVHIGFVNSNLYMAISIQRNMFEPRILRTILNFEIVRGYLEDVLLAVNIVEDLNLNTRIWTKE